MASRYAEHYPRPESAAELSFALCSVCRTYCGDHEQCIACAAPICAEHRSLRCIDCGLPVCDLHAKHYAEERYCPGCHALEMRKEAPAA